MDISSEDLRDLIRSAVTGAATDQVVREVRGQMGLAPGEHFAGAGFTVEDLESRLTSLEERLQGAVTVMSERIGYPSCYDLKVETREGSDVPYVSFINPYYEVSGVLTEGPTAQDNLYTWAKGKFVAILIGDIEDAYGSNSVITLYSTLAQMQDAMRKETQVVIPLYKFDADGEVEMDLRHLPRADMWSLSAGA